MMWKGIGTFLFLFFIGVALAEDHRNELRAIAHLESSSGNNVNHPVIVRGMHKGHQAAGKYGLMPLTIKDMVSKNESLKQKYGYLLELTPQEITEEINRDSITDTNLASFLWKKLRSKYDVKRSAWAWYHGPAKVHAIKQEDIIESEYVKKFTKEMERINEKVRRTRTMGISTAQ